MCNNKFSYLFVITKNVIFSDSQLFVSFFYINFVRKQIDVFFFKSMVSQIEYVQWNSKVRVFNEPTITLKTILRIIQFFIL